MKAKRVRPPSSEAKASKTGPSCPVVGVGASAGGLEAFTHLLRALPVDSGMAFVLVQHLAPTHPSALAEILSRATTMPVMDVVEDLLVEANRVYVIPPGTELLISESRLHLVVRGPQGQHRPIDGFLRSLAQDQRHRGIGVILSGTGSDGTLGIEEIKAAGGITFAQDETALQQGMPKSAIASGCVDFVLPPEGIAKELSHIGRHPYLAPSAAATLSAPASQPDLSKVLQLLHEAAGLDFTRYKHTTLERRISRRMALHKIERLEEYVPFLQTRPEEVQALCQDILIHVTSFFRDPGIFDAVEETVLPRLFRERSQDEPVRLWVIGCSTGEEAYSLAILIQEFAESKRRAAPAQIFATDINPVCIERARAGFYPKDIAQHVSPERLRRFFAEVDGKYRVSKSVRDMCVFAEHDVLSDPPFSRMDLISCRNLLIYLEPVLQQKLVPILHYALNPNAFLWLGSSETTGASSDLFEPVDAKHRIYSKKAGARRLTLRMPAGRKTTGGMARFSRPDERGEAELYREADRILGLTYVPPGVLVDANMEILQFRGDTGAFLAPAPGKAGLNLLKMAREGLLVPLRAALGSARTSRMRARQESVRVESNGGFRSIALEVIPFEGPRETGVFFLVLFEEPHAPDPSAPVGARVPDDAGQESKSLLNEVNRLTQELAATREYLQSVTEEHDAGIEELQSANEEAQSANEELQSVNEELETSKEEIQSASEELATVNDELNHRNLELSQTNDDLVNLVNSIQIAIVIVGADLRIRRISPTAEKLLNLTPGDLGRPIGNVQLPLSLSDIVPLFTEVTDTATTVEREVRDQRGRRFSLRVRPYKTLENKIDGAVLVLVDVDVMSRALELADGIISTLREPVVVLDHSLRVRMANPAFHRTFQISPQGSAGRAFYELSNHEWDTPDLRRLLEGIVSANSTIENFVLEHESERGKRVMVLNARRLEISGETPSLILLVMEDVTEREALAEALKGGVEKLRLADRAKDRFLAMLAHELRGPLAPLSAAASILKHPAAGPDVVRGTHDIIDRQVRGMARLIDDLLDASRVTEGKVRLQLETIEIAEIVTRAVETQRHHIDERSQELVIELPPKPIFLQADPVRMVQVFGNLLENASKYGNKGGRISLSVAAVENVGNAENDEEPENIVVRVRDDGVGISSEMLPRVFDMFAQADASLAHSGGGLGIGLTLVRTLVEAHGGRVEAESAGLGEGSEFTVYLPALSSHKPNPERTARPADPKAGPTASRRVLIVDDNPDAAEALGTALRLEGHSIETARDGPEALSKAVAFEPDAVVLDIGLPGMDGYEVARKLREDPRLARLLLVAVSGYGQDDDRRRAREAGFDHHLTKPVPVADINALIGSREGRER